MSIHEVVAFWRRIETDEALAAEVDAIFADTGTRPGADAGRIVAVGAEHGFDFDTLELRDFLSTQEGELSEAELATAAGGFKVEQDSPLKFKVDRDGDVAFKVEIEGLKGGVILFP